MGFVVGDASKIPLRETFDGYGTLELGLSRNPPIITNASESVHIFLR